MSSIAAVLIPQIAEKIATYSAADLVTILTQIGVLVSVIVAGAVSVIMALRNSRQTERLAVAVAGNGKDPGLIGQVKEIHTLTNANMTAANNKIDKQTVEMKALQETIQTLQEMIEDLKSERDKKELAEVTAKEKETKK